MGKGVEFAAPGLLSSLWSGLSQASEVMEALGCSNCMLSLIQKEKIILGEKNIMGKIPAKALPLVYCKKKLENDEFG